MRITQNASSEPGLFESDKSVRLLSFGQIAEVDSVAYFDPIYSLLTPEPRQAKVLVLEHLSPLCDSVVGFLSDQERSDALQFVDVQDRRSVMIMRGLWKLGAGALLNVDPAGITMHRDPAGRPFFDGMDRAHQDLNVSRTDSCSALILSSGARCGIDIEQVKADQHDPRLYDYFKSEGLPIQGGEHDPDGFYRQWVEAESVLKADGRGLGDGLGVLRRAESGEEDWSSWQIDSQTWRVGTIQTPSGVVGACALDHFPMRLSRISIGEIEAVSLSRILCASGDE